MARVLIVDDAAIDRRLAASFLEKAGWTTFFARDGKEAWEMIERQSPDLVLTDLQMPEVDGLQLVERIREDRPTLPVILMTAHGSEEIAVKALQAGAASYVPKHNLARDLADTVRDVLSVARKQLERQLTLECLTMSESHFVLADEVWNLEPFITHLQNNLRQMGLCSEGDLIRVGTALHEALVNANEHGNLELDSVLREDDTGVYHRLARERSSQAPYKDRRVHVATRLTRDEATFVIRDEGPGFDHSKRPDPTDPANLEKVSGRGLFLIHTFMDDVRFNAAGNEITMIKRRSA